jgi:uncharacterized repeat protein (TIGR01451 family)
VVAQASALAASGSVALNQAGISTATPGDDPGDNTSSTATIVQRADVRVTKSSPTGFPVASGQPVAYDIDYANAGPATARNVTLNDTVPAQIANVVWQCSSGCAGSGTGNTLALSLGDLVAGASGRVRVSGVAQTSTAREDFTNTAIIATTTPETDLANNQSSVPGAVWTSDLQLIKLAQAQVAAGDSFTATLAYKNNGPAPAAGTILSDTLPSGITFVSASPAPAAVSGSLLSWNLGTLADGQSGSIGLVLRSDPAAPDATVVVNRAQISTATSDRDPANNTSAAATLLLARADVMVLKTAPARADAGDLIQYSLSYRNNGPSVARSALLTDTLPAELTFVSAGPAPRSSAGSVLTWALGDLAPGQAGSITVQARSRFAQELPRLSLINTAQISSSTNDPAPANNTSSATTAIETADLSVIKRAPQYIIAGAPFTVTLDYANAGPASARNATLRDLLPGGLTFVSARPAPTGPGLRWSLGDLAGGARGSISVVLRAPTSAISGTTYTNVAVIDTPASPDRDPGNDVSSTISAVQPNADLSILKRGPAAPVRSGSQVSYQLTYHNAGPSQALQARVVDVLPAGFSFTSASPAPTQVTSTTLTWALGTLDAGTGGSITVVGQLAGAGATTLRTNIATIDSPATPDPAPGNNTSTVDTTVLRPDLSVFKTDHLTTAQPGDTLTYDLSVRNTGATTATGVLLRESPPPGAVVLSSAWAGQSDGSYTLALGDLAAGAVATRQFALRLPNPLPAPAGPIANTVVVSDDGSAGADPTPADNTSTDIDTPLAGRLGDFVWYDKDGDGQQEAGEAGLGDVTMRLIDANGALLATTTTDLSGHYLFEGVRMGSYAVALAPATTQVGLLRGYRYTTPPTPIGTISVASPADLALDIGLHNPGSTDIVLAYLRAERGEDGTVALSWRTLEEINTAHFRVLRAPTERLSTASPIAQLQSQGSGGGVYRLLDPQPLAHAFYWLVEVERSGREQIYGPLDPQPVATTATLLTFVPIVRR